MNVINEYEAKRLELIWFYEDNFDLLVKKINRICGNYHDAEDVVQDAFERAVTYLHTCNDMDKWFSIILRNTYRDFVRRKMNWPVSSPIEEHYDELEPILIDHSRPLMTKTIMEMVEQEKEPARTVLTMHIDYGFSQGEICCLVSGVSVGMVHNILNRFKRKVIKRLK